MVSGQDLETSKQYTTMSALRNDLLNGITLFWHKARLSTTSRSPAGLFDEGLSTQKSYQTCKRPKNSSIIIIIIITGGIKQKDPV